MLLVHAEFLFHVRLKGGLLHRRRNMFKMISLFLLLQLLLLAAAEDEVPSTEEKKNNTWDPFEQLFPENLRDFNECLSISNNPGERGVCQLLAATSRQIQLLQKKINSSSSSSTISSSSSSSKCRYKDEDGASLHRYSSKRSPSLHKLLQSYAEMHRSCVDSEYNELKRLHEQKLNPRCRYIVWSCQFGLGNRLMSLISAFLYALLSQRVLLVDNPGWDKLFCEPFSGSHWQTPPGFSLVQDASFGDSFSRYYDDYRKKKKKKNLGNTSARVVPVAFLSSSKPSEHRFLVCPSAMASLREVPILNFKNSNQYFAVGFFLNPALRPVLEELFPERRVFHDLAHFLLNPSDAVWPRIRRIHDTTLAKATRTIGVQIRDGYKGQYTAYYDTTVPLCVRSKTGLCPIELEQGLLNATTIAVYVSTLVRGHAHKLNDSLRAMEMEMSGVRFELAGQEPDGKQMDDPDHQQKALVDMWALSLSDVLITSGMSTFGYTAQALAGVTPYRLTHWPNDPCLPAISSDPCFHFSPPKGMHCDEDGFAIAPGKPNYVWACRDFAGTGLQLAEP